MTTIAWDGKTLAADRRIVNDSGAISTTYKLIRLGPQWIAGGAGNSANVAAMLTWLANGADPQCFPACQEGDDFCHVLSIMRDMESGRILVFKYERGAIPIPIMNEKTAIGSGKDFARMAMHLGKDAADAVLLTSEFDCFTGNGVDTLMLEEFTGG